MKQKAQSEIMGLVVIVIIITVVLLFYVSSSITDTTSTKKSIFRQYTNNELSASFTKAFIDTSVCQTTIDGLIYDCATVQQLRCNGLSSCEQLNKTLHNITAQTLDAWGYVYDITINLSNDYSLHVGSGQCTPETIGRSPPSPYSIPLYPWTGTARIELGICN